MQKDRVLIADDNIELADAFKQLLELHGYSVRVAHDGAQALAAAHEFKPQIGLLDINMAAMNGFEVAKALRQSFSRDELLLVAVTAQPGKDIDGRAMAAGFDHCFRKSSDVGPLLTLVHEAAEGKLADLARSV